MGENFPHMSDAILPNFHLAAIYNKVYLWKGSASSAMPPTSVSDVMGQQNEIGVLRL